jgi:hypothetical protein
MKSTPPVSGYTRDLQNASLFHLQSDIKIKFISRSR